MSTDHGTMVIMALVLSLLTLPAFGVRQEGLERISFSSEPLNSVDYRPAGLIEAAWVEGGREIKKEDRSSTKKDPCDRNLWHLKTIFTKTCDRYDVDEDGRPGSLNLNHLFSNTKANCRNLVENTIEHSVTYRWQDHLTSAVLKARKTPVFWAGFRPEGKKGIDTREALADFISSVNGFQLADTEWGQAAESRWVNNLEACTWDRQKNWWKAASISMADAMAVHQVQHIKIALHKTLHGKYSFYDTVLYLAELVYMGSKMQKSSTWNPQFEVRSIAVKGAPPDESGCALASEVKSRLEFYAKRSVMVWCRPCTTLRRCGPKQQVEKKNLKAGCIGNCQNGQGTFTWADGSTYQGQWMKGKMDVQGTFTWAKGDKYQGQWKNGKKDGQGTYTNFATGEKYNGQWKNDEKDGQGSQTWADGSRYQGRWKNGLMDKGSFTFPNGNTYKGEYKNGKQHGKGSFSSTGHMYKQNSQGIWTTTGYHYQGQWKNGKKDGQGTYTNFATGEKYNGQWKNDEKDGQGTYTEKNGGKFETYKVWYKEGFLVKKVKKK